MKISAINGQASFGRAFSTKELKEYTAVKEQARKQLGLNKTTAVCPGFSFPPGSTDTGIGTGYSAEAAEMMKFLNTMCDINSIQTLPESEISNYVRSPYSGTSFSLGEHLIDLTKLREDDYGNILKSKDFDTPFFKRAKNKNKVDYDNIFAPDGQTAVLKKAYSRFEMLDETSPLKQEFETFKKENSYWLERDALYEAAAVENGSEDMRTWTMRDQNVFGTPKGDRQRIKELKQVRDNNGNNVVDYEEFVQFIADKQLKEAKKTYNEQGIDIYGDSKIGFSQKDYWAHKSAFAKNAEFGCDIGGGEYACWSAAIDFDKLDGEAGELLYNRFDTFFKRYDGVRVDAAWQLVNPLVCEPLKDNNGNDVFDSNGNKLGKKLKNQPEIPNDGKYIIENVLLKAADNNNIPHDKVFLEMLGGNSYQSLDVLEGTGTTLIHITRYGRDDWGRVKYYESKGENKYQNMNSGGYTIGAGTHDDNSLEEQADEAQLRIDYLANDLKLNKKELEHSHEARAKAITAELFTTENQFMTLPDIFGSRKRINMPNTTDDNWSYRVPKDYQREYFQNLSEGKGLNLADAYGKALKAKYGASYLTNKLDYFSNILRASGPMTIKEADKVQNI